MNHVNAEWLALIPPLVAIGLALMTKEVFSSLLVGIFSGTLIYSQLAGKNILLGTVETAFKMMAEKLDFNILIFCSLLGALVYVISLSGGMVAYGKQATKIVRGRKSSLLATSGLGMSIFIDDYFNCLTVGTVMRPITDLYRVSRVKLAYIIDSTAAPICIIAPVSSWAAAVGSSLKGTGAFDSDMGAFIATIPWNFYALLCLGMVLFVSISGFDFGSMYRAERAADRQNVSLSPMASKEPMVPNPRGTAMDMLIPLAALIVFSVLSLMHSGGYWGADPKYHTFMAAIGNSSASIALAMASLAALLVAMLLYVPRRLVSFRGFFEGTVEGMKMMLPANLILILAWTLSGVCRDLLQLPQFVQTVVSTSGLGAAWIPVLVFAIAGFLSFSTGTAWGTFGILIPIVVPVIQALDPSLTVIALSATLAGAVFGDHCSPISDTTILASAGSGCHHIEHVSTQIPYCLTVALSSAVGYVVAGFTGGSLFMSFLAALGTLVLSVCTMHAMSVRKGL